MTDELRRKANEAFKAKLAELKGAPAGPKSEIAGMREAQGLLGIDMGNFCETAPHAIDLAQKEIRQFAMFIPDKYEHPILAVLAGFEAILPEFCGAEEKPAAPAGGVKKNFRG